MQPPLVPVLVPAGHESDRHVPTRGIAPNRGETLDAVRSGHAGLGALDCRDARPHVIACCTLERFCWAGACERSVDSGSRLSKEAPWERAGTCFGLLRVGEGVVGLDLVHPVLGLVDGLGGVRHGGAVGRLQGPHVDDALDEAEAAGMVRDGAVVYERTCSWPRCLDQLEFCVGQPGLQDEQSGN